MTAAEHWLSIVGIGEDGWDGLNDEAKRAVESAELVYGGARHLALVPTAVSSATRIPWPSPMTPAVQQILTEYRGKKRVTVLASGDPMLHGVGVPLTRDIVATEFRVIPQVSAFSLACARLGWPMAETTLITLVNRPVEQLLRHLYPDQRLVIFSKDGSTPATVARLLTESGYGSSKIDVFENLGGSSERSIRELAACWLNKECGMLNLMAVLCAPDTTGRPLSLAPGLPDDTFDTDGQLTKREVRAVTLARLAPLPNQTLWDVGAGTGSIGIEWMRVHPSCSCIAFEAREDRAVRIRENAARLCVPTLKVIQGTAPATFASLRPPDAIFIGGGVGSDELFDACWAKLSPGGRLVANAVTLQSEASLITRHTLYGGDLMRMTVSRADLIGGLYGWRPMMPITQWTVTKA
ncbi:precorrin-6y C5,15-methyltransferase (decarboxylating) subunit CbiE [Edaphobacter modestus]|uniref:Precorrin-6Y C5,15-methyltransferase (Decarboxylating) n=1 Tax=Edaphobacter modestus TaxID=388466 RepID=A0A4Q7YSE7_9BACT|nr:precorrin-6y C5,15-methyltransferase (decarboxylating) subunit CbiE [Edaphobacter modestus]RZU40144.1 precorrin-6Y C5,15-methyltransferase (decarboxylating) [Edaphobacter modestus]